MEQRTPKRVGLGDYKPDLALLANNGLAVAKNTVPINGGYGGISAPANLSTFTAVSDRVRGAIGLIDREGNPYNFAGTATTLEMHKTSTVDVSRVAGGAYNCSGQLYWEFVEFGGVVIGVNPADDSQYYTMGESTEFKQLGNPDETGTVAPRAAHIGSIGSFIMMGNTYDDITGDDPSGVHWCGLNDIFNWPDPGTDVALAVQSGRQTLKYGGIVQRVVSGAEVAAIFMENAIYRADYRGGDVVFEFTRVEPNRGCLIPAVAVPFGREIFYLSEDGFYLFDYTQSTPIGREVIDQTFLSDVDGDQFHRISAVKDPDSQRIYVLYPGSGHTGGTPNKFIVYDHGLNRFSHGEITAEWLTRAINAGVDLDSAGIVGDPDSTLDDPAYPAGGVDGVGLASFDQRQAAPGALRLGVYSTTHRLQDFSGNGLAAVLETGRRELEPGYRSMTSRVRPMVDAVDPTIQVAAVGRTNSTPIFSPISTVRDDGSASVRKDGRYHTFRVNLPTGFEDALGFDVYSMMTGRR